MSFSSEVKNELAALEPENACCRAAEAYGLLEFGHAFTAGSVSLQTENEAVAARYGRLLKQVCRVDSVRSDGRKGGFYTVSVPEEEKRLRVLERFGHSGKDVTTRLNRANLECDDCPAAYVRGAFLSCGAVTNPASDYHMEFSVPYLNLCRDLMTLLAEMGLHAKQVRRKGSYVVYFKESEQIEDCLTMMGAINATLELMNVKMVKDIRNTANRITNCESANIDKTVAAAAVQVEAVKRILRTVGLDALPEELRELAQLRLENPELSLRELGEALEQPISRSGVNHRLRRIQEFAQRL